MIIKEFEIDKIIKNHGIIWIPLFILRTVFKNYKYITLDFNEKTKKITIQPMQKKEAK